MDHTLAIGEQRCLYSKAQSIRGEESDQWCLFEEYGCNE